MLAIDSASNYVEVCAFLNVLLFLMYIRVFWFLIMFILQNCDMLPNPVYNPTVQEFYNACEQWQDRLQDIKQANKLENHKKAIAESPEITGDSAAEKAHNSLEKADIAAQAAEIPGNTDAKEENKEDAQGDDDTTARYYYKDLNPYIQNVIMVDGIEEILEANGDPTVKLSTTQLEHIQLAILSYLTTSLPSVAIGTLRHGTDGWKDSASLVEANIPVLFLDVRNPVDFEGENDAEKLIEKAKQVYDGNRKEIEKCGRLDVLDTCRMAYYHRVWQKAKMLMVGETPSEDVVTIHNAIKLLEDEKKKANRDSQVVSLLHI
jgi:hypothetical protein